MEPTGHGVLAGLDVISIRNLRTWSLIGVFPHERQERQELRVDAWLGTDTRSSAAGDDLSRSIDYGEVARAFRDHAGSATHQLVETLAEELAGLAIDRFGASAIRLRVEKLGAIPGADAVGVTIERPRASEPESAG
ncbi:MAG: dihydroneopterin aldolase [Planctomycetota bacterium]|nr:dihydroneopterin aldolase [Planctomycetota bacterium]MEC8513419.1 dihydroneopterin aldolase [Planctomycetota bacterium]